MRKIKMMMAVIFCCTMTATVLTSCGDDDDDDYVQPEVEKATVKDVTVYITATPTADMLKYADLEITLTDDKGDVKGAVVNSEEFKVKKSYTEFPVNAVIRYIQKPKEGVTAKEGETIHWNYVLHVQKVMTMSDGSTKGAAPYDKNATIDIPGENLAKYLEGKDVLAETTIVIDKDGNIR